MPSMIKECKKCYARFEITDSDQKFYDQMQVPTPTLCPNCREQKRTLQVNHHNLFKRKCDGSDKDMISHYPSDCEYRVYSQEYWFSDQFDPTQYGQDFNFDKSFFEQFGELNKKVPRRGLFTDYFRDENSDYTNYAGINKNCYLIFDSDENWDCMYSYGLNSSRNSLDCNRCVKLELCYESLDSTNCYDCSFIQDCENCSSSLFLKNCIGCQNCIFCSNLKNKKYHIANKPVSKGDYEKAREQIESYQKLQDAIKKFEDIKLKFPQKYLRGFQNENCSGNYLINCKNAIHCFDSMKIWDGKYCYRMFTNSKNCFDCTECGDNVELLYECNTIVYNGYNLKFCTQCIFQNSNLTYCDTCNRCKNLFGCTNLKDREFCVLNKQYTEEQYEELVPKIIEHMKKTSEWGENFPASLSPHPYNLTVAQDYFPLTKEQALSSGYKWRDPDKRDYLSQKYEIPDNINDVNTEICDQILACMKCQKNYKIDHKELKFYKQQGLPVPRFCFECRHKFRMSLRNLSRILYERQCDKCSQAIQTTYSPQRPETIYCEKCYSESLT